VPIKVEHVDVWPRPEHCDLTSLYAILDKHWMAA